ncbi:MAG: AMP-dependent synthetase, partial [Novosphingobium sp.]|nr:AMP-dependent synthetase [Novosphingobium sp.]
MQHSDFDSTANLVALFLTRAAERGDLPFLWAKHDGRWQSQSWDEAARQVCLIAEGLRRMGLGDGDRVVLVSENRPEWCLADLAIMAAGCVTVPAYTTNTERDHRHILENSEASAVIVSNEKLAKSLLPAVLNTNRVRHVIGIDSVRAPQSGTVEFHDWAELLEGDAAAARSSVEARVA